MTQADMCALIARRCAVTGPVAHDAIVALLAEIAYQLAMGNRVRLPGIGSLAAVATKPRKNIRNPRTGAAMPDLPPGWKIRFSPAAAMKARLAPVKAGRGA